MINSKVSIVVPVYNVEKYLSRCIESVCQQTYGNIEIILVDDGSTDSSGLICDEYAKERSNITVLHKKNGGLSDARNYGMKAAVGEFILFVDSDDYIALDAVEKLLRILSIEPAVDIVIGRYKKEKEDTDTSFFNAQNTSKVETFDGLGYLKKSLRDNTFVVTAWSKLYRRRFLSENNISFMKGLIHEDELFTMQCLLKAKKIVDTDIVFYKYMIREGSIMTANKQVHNAVSINRIVHLLESEYDRIDDKELQKLLRDHSATIIYQSLSKVDKKSIVDNKLDDYAFIKKCSISTKNRIRYVALSISNNLLKYLV